MAKIQLKRSVILDGNSAKEPTSSQMEYGEIAVNYNKDDPSIFIKDSNDAVIRIAGVNAIGNKSSDIDGYPDITDGKGASLDDRYLKIGTGIGAQVVQSSFATDFNGGLKASGGSTYLLEVANSGATKLVVLPNGNVGIGTTSPTAPLDVNGEVIANSFSGSGSTLTSLDGGNISQGVINTARLPAIYTLAEGITIEATGSLSYLKLNSDKEIELTANGTNSFIKLRGNNGQGSYRFSKAGQDSIEGFLDFESLTADRIFTYPNTSGTLALISSTINNSDKVDGLHASSFLRADSSDTATGDLTFNGRVNIRGNVDISNAQNIDFGDNDDVQITYNSDDWLYCNFKTGNGIVFQDNGSDKIRLEDSGQITASNIIESTAGGFKFPDGTVLTTAGGAGGTQFNVDIEVNDLTVGRGAGNVSTNSTFGNEALNSNTTGSGIVAIGYKALYANTTGSSNVAIGYEALKANTTGYDNIAIGETALTLNTSGEMNVAVGDKALSQNTTGDENIAIGVHALINNTTGNWNTATGSYTLTQNTTGSLNVAAGYQALNNNTTGSNNVANGYKALYENTTGGNNVASGDYALVNNTTGSYNIAIGSYALSSNTTGHNNTANGSYALYSNTTGQYNTANGYRALYSNTTGSYNIANGRDTLLINTTGSNNVANGYEALRNNTTGSSNVAIGRQALLANTTGDNNVASGKEALRSNTTGYYNVANGYYALYENTTGTDNVAIGYNALYSNTNGERNTANGTLALRNNTTGYYNVATGYEALRSNTTGFGNVANGYEALNNNTTGDNNVANGRNALYFNTTGEGNIANGPSTLYRNTTGDDNIASGEDALYENTTGLRNVATGYQALHENTTGDNNVANGPMALYYNTTGSGNIGIGFYALNGYSPVFDPTTEDNRLVLGHTYITNAYVKVAWTVTSDERDKMNFAPVPYGLDFVNQLKPTAYQFKVDRNTETPNGDVRYGFKAQDILALEGSNPVIIDNEDADHLKYKGEHLVPVLVNAVQELTTMVKDLQNEIKTLKGQS